MPHKIFRENPPSARLTNGAKRAIMVAYATIWTGTAQPKRGRPQEVNAMPTLMRQINVISRCGARFRTEKFRPLGLCAPHHSYLLAVCKNPGISQEQLAEHICVDKSNVTRQLTYLEKEGYVERRQSDTDRRVTLVYPTQKALAALPAVRETVAAWNGYLTQDLTEEELSLLSDILQKLSERARKYFDGREEGE